MNARTFYLILAHKNIAQLKLLCNVLKNDDSILIIHLDSKTDISRDDTNWFSNQDGVFLISVENRVNVKWGGFSQVLATIELLKGCYKFLLPGEKAYFHLMSGLDFPIWPVQKIQNFFYENYGTIYLNWHSMPFKGWNFNGGLDRVLYKWYIDDLGPEASYEMYQQQLKQNDGRQSGDFYGGSQWWSITRECLDFIMSKVQNEPEWLDKFKYSLIPDEVFFHTMLLTSSFSKLVINNNCRYIDWDTGPQYPRLLTIQDFNKLSNSSACFARKIDSEVSPDLINKISECLI